MVDMPEKEGSLLIPKIKTVEHYSNEEKTHSRKKGSNFFRKPIFKFILFLLVVFVGVSALVGVLVYRVYVKAQVVRAKATEVMAAVSENDLEKMKSKINETKEATESLQTSYKTIFFLKWAPFAGDYVKDGEHAIKAGLLGLDTGTLVIDTMTPYADLLGFTKGSEQAESGMETAQDRIDFVIKTLPELAPKADQIAQKVSEATKEIDQIDPNRYPEEFMGKPLRAKIKEAIEMWDLGASFIVKSKPLLEASSYILGAEDVRNYLVIFQNDKELRATGGFITAYSLAKVNNGKFEPVSSSDIYSLDNKYKASIDAPDPMIKYIKGIYIASPKLRLRDMNWNPDFEKSMDMFSEEIKEAGIKDIDGIIAVDTQLLVNLLDAIGPIGVGGFGNFSTDITPECNCPQVIYELESFADVEGPVVWSQDEPGKIIFAPPNYDNRKKIIGPLMNSILANALGQPKDKIPGLFEAVIKSLMEKHVLFYFFDDKAQKAVDEFGIAGTLSKADKDYFHLNDSNLGGRKSNLYVTQEVEQEINVLRDKTIEKTVTITYKNPAPYDGWLNSVLPNWVRVYVPEGSELVEFNGISEKAEIYKENGKTVYAGHFELRPLGVAKLTLKYKLPFKDDGDYRLFLQKQPGKADPLYIIKAGRNEQEIKLNTDKEIKINI